jgi:hypothetical protein
VRKQALTERRVRAALASWPDGAAEAEIRMEDGYVSAGAAVTEYGVDALRLGEALKADLVPH